MLCVCTGGEGLELGDILVDLNSTMLSVSLSLSKSMKCNIYAIFTGFFFTDDQTHYLAQRLNLFMEML